MSTTVAAPPRLDAVNDVRMFQRQWLQETRERVQDGGFFAICNGDEFEDVFIAMDIPVIAINYWNFVIAAQNKKAYYYDVLNQRGYPGEQFFALGLASSIEPENAPWGGLPKPTLICGSLRYENELRVTELWAQEYGCPNIPMDFAFPSPKMQEYPKDWWNHIHDDWESLVDSNRLEYRLAQSRRAITYVEQLTGRTFTDANLEYRMGLLNEQMAHWERARMAIASSKPCPVTMKDQMSMYQTMWHRGTEHGVRLVKNYADEAEERARKGIGGYKNEKFRFFYGHMEPPFSKWAEEEHGLVAVACSYTGFPHCYARTVHNNDPLRALAGRHILLSCSTKEWILKQAQDHQCDAIIQIEPHTTPEYPSVEARMAEDAGIPYLAIPEEADSPRVRELITEFVETRLQK